MCGYRGFVRIGLILGLALGLLLQTGCSQPTQDAEPAVLTQPTEADSPAQEKPAPPPTKTASPRVRVEPVPEKASPTITLTETVHDFGEISPRSKNVCEFRFKNTGTATLKLKPKIDSTCGCTVPILSRVSYAPGQTGVIKVTYSASTSIGSVQKTMTVHSNDPAHAQVKLMIKAKTVQRVACDPQKIQLRLKDDNGACPPITLRSLNGVPFSITKVTSSGNAMTAAFDPNVQGQTLTLQPIVDLVKLEKRLAGYLLVDVTHPECKQVRIQYNTLRQYQFKPAYVMAFNVEPNEPVTKEVDLINNYGEDFDIQSVSSQKGIVKLLDQENQTLEGNKGVSYRLKLSLTPPANLKKGRMFVDVLTVRLTSGKELRLSCRGVYSRKGIGSPSGITPVRRR
jgi:hypothetical protein